MAVDRANLGRCIAVVNLKGGVGKTSITTNTAGIIAAAYAASGSDARVCVVDLDPQGNVALDLGVIADSDQGHGFAAAAFSGGRPPVMADVRPHLDIVPGGEQLHDLVGTLNSRSRRSTARPRWPNGTGTDAGEETLWDTMVNSLNALAEDYTLVLLDCPPGNDLLIDGALAAARHLIIPAKSDAASQLGLRDISTRFDVAWRAGNKRLGLLGVVLFGANPRATVINGEARRMLAGDLSGAPNIDDFEIAPNSFADALVFTTEIRDAQAAGVHARARGRTTRELTTDAQDGSDRAVPESAWALADSYDDFVTELDARLQTLETAPAGEAPHESLIRAARAGRDALAARRALT